jgi:hypothetical protein
MKPSELLSQPDTWCQGCFAKTIDGSHVSSINPEAVQWCLIGALNRCIPTAAKRESALSKLKHKARRKRMADWNDKPSRRQAEVVALLQSVGL